MFIEITNANDGKPLLVGIRYIRFIRQDPRDGKAVLEPIEGVRITCQESYDQVRLALSGGTPSQVTTVM